MKDSLFVSRSEKKYLIPINYMSELKMKLSKILDADDNSNVSGYMVRSLYFDSINNIDFNTKLDGVLIRKKIRIRVYDTNSKKCKLEMKKKNGDYGYKVSIWITKNDVEDLINGKYYVLKKYFKNSKDAIEIFMTMSLGCYKPVVMVEYFRYAFVYPLFDTRITFDYKIRSSESNFDLFSNKITYNHLLDNKVILEIKYNGKLVNFISDIFKTYDLNRLSISKYCYGRKIFYDFNY